jgi:Plasma-membrane choline transporter
VTNGTDLTAFKYLFIDVSVSTNFLKNSVCVKSCPTTANLTVDCAPTFFVPNCQTLTAYDSSVVLNRFCIPSNQTVLQKVGSLFSGFNMESVTESIYANRYILLSSVGLAFVLSYAFTIVLQYCTWLLILISIVGIYVVGIIGGLMCWSKYKSVQQQAVAPGSSGADNNQSTAKFYKYMAIGLWTCVVLFTLAIIFALAEIRLAVAVIQASADFVSDHKVVVFIPILIITVMGAFMLYWSWGLAVIYSTGEIYHDPNYPWGKIRGNDALK